MTTYARISADGLAVEVIVDLTPQQYAALQANGKAARLRLWIVDPQPSITSGQVIEHGPISIGAVEAHQTWVVRAKTQKELDAESNVLELPQLVAWIDQWTTDIQAYTANPDMSGTIAVQAANLWIHVKDLQRQVKRNNQALRFLARERRP